MLVLLATLFAIQAGSDSVVYTVARDSRFEVQVGSSGMFGFLGHEHRIRANAVRGRAVYYARSPARSHIEIVLRADSLEVLTPPDTAELRKVTEVMRTQVLSVDRYPEIRFVSRDITFTATGFRVRGDLTIAGVTRSVAADLTGSLGGDRLHAAGRLAVKQTDYGIKPVRAGAGTVRVADQVVIDFEVVGSSRSQPE